LPKVGQPGIDTLQREMNDAYNSKDSFLFCLIQLRKNYAQKHFFDFVRIKDIAMHYC